MPPRGFRRIEIVERYYPLDQMLDALRVRVLRAIRHFDSASAVDVAIALDEHDPKVRAALSSTIENLLRDGQFAHVRRAANETTYRITAKGRRALADLLHRGELDITPGMRP